MTILFSYIAKESINDSIISSAMKFSSRENFSIKVVKKEPIRKIFRASKIKTDLEIKGTSEQIKEFEKWFYKLKLLF